MFSTPRWRRRARIAALIFVVALAAFGTMIGSTLPDFSANNGASVPAGLFVDSQSPTDVVALGKQLGVTPTIMTVYADGSCYCTYANPPSTSMTLMLGVGALTAAQATSIGQSLVAAGQSNAIIRVMWEQNQDVGGWFPSWNQSALTSSQYIATFQTIVTTMRAVPGEGFRFMWNPNGGTGNEAPGRTWQDTWPGSRYVNYVGIDQYDYSGYAANIQAVVAFAQSQGLPTAIPEWGLDGSDDPSYITSVANLVRDSANNIAFQCYFSYGGGNTNSDITQFPNSESAYRAAFDATTPTTGPPPTTVSPTTTVSPPTTVSPSTTPTGPPPHVMVVVMENKNYSDVIGQSTQPVTNTLATGYGLATQSYALFHPSLPNYLDLISGSNQGVTMDEPPSSSGTINKPTLATQLAAAGFSAKAYAENLPGDATNDSGEYAVRHFPWEYFANPPAVGSSSQLTTDLNATTPPDFVWYTPNLINDEHDGSVQQGDSFLASFIPAVQATSWYKNGGQIVVTWDESASDNTNGGGRVPTIVVSDNLKANPAQSSTKVDTTGILHSIEDTYGLPHLGGSSADGSIDSLLSPSTPPPPTTTTTSPPTTAPPTTTVPSTTTTTSPRRPTTPPTTAPSSPTTTSPPPTAPTTTTVPSTTTTTSPPPTSPLPPTSPSPPTTPPTTVPSLQPTVTTVTMAPDEDESRQVLTATVSPAPDGGTVAFSVDGQGLTEPVPVDRDGTAVTSVDLADGPHPVTATYSGTSEFASSSVDLVLAVGQAPTSLTTSAPSLSPTGTQYVLNATLTSAGSPIVGALVSFTALGSPLCQSTTDTEGSATCSIDTDPSQAPFLTTTGYTATFEGDPTHLPASSHSPIFGDEHWRDHHHHSDDSQWRRPSDSDHTFLDSGRPSSPTSESPASPTIAPGTAPTTERGAEVSAIAETSTVKQSGSGYVVGLFVLLGMILCTAILRRRRLVWTGPRPWRRHPR